MNCGLCFLSATSRSCLSPGRLCRTATSTSEDRAFMGAQGDSGSPAAPTDAGADMSAQWRKRR